MTDPVNIETYSDADFVLSQQSPIRIGTNPLYMHVRTAADDATVWIEATTANGMLAVAVGVDFDTITLTIYQSKLLNLPPGVYVQSLIMSSAGGTVRTEIWRGTFTHSAGPTRFSVT
jgi:hypothetical protein